MNSNHFALLPFLILFTTCKGQESSQTKNPITVVEPAIKCDTIKEPGNNIMVIFQDSKNNYWFGSWETGLYKYDGKAILHFTTENGLPHNRVEEIKEDKAGNILINTTAGLCKYDGKQLTKIAIIESNEWKLEPDDLWFKNLQTSHRVLRYDGKNLYSLTTPTCEIGEEWFKKYPNYSDPYGIYMNYKDSKGNIWFGTAVLGAFRYNGKNFDWITEEDVTEMHNGPSNGVRSIIEDKDGYFWFNSAFKYAIDDFSLTDKSFYKRLNGPGNIDGNPDDNFNEYLSITKTKNGDLWIASYMDGVYKFDGKKFTHFPVTNEGKTISTFYIYTDRQDNLWLGTHENGVYRFTGKSFEKFKP